jgi:hypothetical protein
VTEEQRSGRGWIGRPSLAEFLAGGTSPIAGPLIPGTASSMSWLTASRAALAARLCLFDWRPPSGLLVQFSRREGISTAIVATGDEHLSAQQ